VPLTPDAGLLVANVLLGTCDELADILVVAGKEH
jgi:hypothetical protein